MSDTPRTDNAVLFAISRGMTLAPLAEFARDLERENAALREALATAEDGLKHGLMMQPADPFQRGRVISAALDAVRAALGKEAKP